VLHFKTKFHFFQKDSSLSIGESFTFNCMNVGIVVPCFNAVETIENTLLSLLEQTYCIHEIWVIDGASTDGTIEILKRYSDKINWVSEKDRGQTDAINKGFSRLSSDIIKWVNADDLLVETAVQDVVDFFSNNIDKDFVYGDIEFIDREGAQLGLHREPSFSPFIMIYGHNLFADPTCFWRRTWMISIPELAVEVQYSMDYWFWLKLLKKGGKFGQIKKVLAKYRVDDHNVSIANHQKMRHEHFDICIDLFIPFLSFFPKFASYRFLNIILVTARIYKKIKIKWERGSGKSFSFGNYIKKDSNS